MGTSTQLIRGSAAAWAAVNPIIPGGALAFETDTFCIAVGDGVNAWASLARCTTGLSADQNAALANPAGAAGSTGSTATTFIFAQPVPAALWTIEHNLSRFPDVTMIDLTGGKVEGDVAYVDSNNLTVTFSMPFAGTAYVN